jgi:hypothetical protein
VNKIKFKDSVILEHLIGDSAKSDAAELLRRDKSPKLKVEIDATHSGVLINNRVYPGRHVQHGYKSFFSKARGGTSDFDKPILKHHDLYDDPIGRIIDAKYTQLKYGESFEQDFLSPDSNGSKGSGVVTITGIISDPDAIKKIVDSRFLSVSAGHTSPSALCSTCGESVLDCEHMPGRRYDQDGELNEESGTPCYVITGPMTYHECSFVNLPASPPARLVNFSWTDSKESWNKDSIITTQIAGKRESVRNLILCDESGELSLLTGKHDLANKKTVIAVSHAIADKLKHKMSSEQPAKVDEANDVRLTNAGSGSGVQNVEQNLDKANNLDNTSKEEQEMDAKKLESLETEVKSLTDQLAAAKTELETIKKQVEAKDAQIQRLTTDSASIQAKMTKSLAHTLASVRLRLKKADTVGVDSKEKTDAYVESLSKRSLDSLQDSLQDIMSELDQLGADTKQETKTTPAAEVIAKDKVSNPTLAKKDKVETKNSKKGNGKAIDSVFGD